MKHMLIACALTAGTLFTACKKENADPEIIVCPPPSSGPLTGTWSMSTVNVNMVPGAIIPEYSFSGNAYIYKEGMQNAPKQESGTYTMIWNGNNEPRYTIKLVPVSGAARTIEVNFVSDKQFSTGTLTWNRK